MKFNEEVVNDLICNHDLSVREAEVAFAISSGKSNKEIANEFFISLKTIEYHVYNLMKKLAARTRVCVAILVKDIFFKFELARQLAAYANFKASLLPTGFAT